MWSHLRGTCEITHEPSSHITIYPAAKITLVSMIQIKRRINKIGQHKPFLNIGITLLVPLEIESHTRIDKERSQHSQKVSM